MGVTLVLRRRQILAFAVFIALVVGAVLLVAQHWSAVGRDGLSGATLVAAAVRTSSGATSAPNTTRATGRPLTPAVQAAARAEAGGSAGSAAGYFAAARLRRAQSESRERAQLQQLSADGHASATLRAEAGQQLLQLEQLRQEETTAELILQAKGYAQSLVMLTPGGATVIVGASAFTATDAARVGQAVAQVAGLDPAQVQIIPHAVAQR